MKKIIKLVFPFAALLFFNSAVCQTKTAQFTINGNVQGYKNGTMLYLNDATISLKPIDSTSIVDGKFLFKGRLKTTYLSANISTTDFTDRVYFWIEHGTTYFKAEKGDFVNALIYGTTLQNEQNKLNKLRGTAANTQRIDYKFIKANPNSIISANTLSEHCNTWHKDTVKYLYNRFSQLVKATNSGKNVSDFIKFNRNIKVGDKFVDFAQRNAAGKRISVSDFKGKVILLEFWGSWCGPCREQNPLLLEIYNELKPKGFEIIGIATESSKQDWINVIEADHLTWTNITDLKGSNNEAALIYGVTGYPMNFLIGRNGIVIAKEVYGEELRKLVLENL